jgi:hypothetical protein
MVSLANMNVCMSCLFFKNVVWFLCMRTCRSGCSLVTNIFVIILGMADKIVMGLKSCTVDVSTFFGIRVMYAWFMRQRLRRL